MVVGWDDGGRWESDDSCRRNGGGKRRRGRDGRLVGGWNREGYRRRLRVRRRRKLVRLLKILSVDILLLCFGFAFHPAESLAVFGKSGFRGGEYVRGEVRGRMIPEVAGEIRCSL